MAGICSNKSLNDNILMSGKKHIPWLKGCGVSPNGFRLENDLQILSGVTIYGDMLTYIFGIQTHNVKWELHGLFNVVVFFPQPDVITWLMVIQTNLQKLWKSLKKSCSEMIEKKWSKLPVHKGGQLKIIKCTNYCDGLIILRTSFFQNFETSS